MVRPGAHLLRAPLTPFTLCARAYQGTARASRDPSVVCSPRTRTTRTAHPPPFPVTPSTTLALSARLRLQGHFAGTSKTVSLRFLSQSHKSLKMSAYKIVMVRHGESEWNQKNLFCGWFDANLSPKGKSGRLCLMGVVTVLCNFFCSTHLF